jgi:hypothetical protein
MVLSVAEEILAKQQCGVLVEVTRLQDMIAELKEVREVEQRQAAANANRLHEIAELEVARERVQEQLLAETGRLRSTISELGEAVTNYETQLSSRQGKTVHSLTSLIIPPPLGQAASATYTLKPPSDISSSHPIHSITPTFTIETSYDAGSSTTEMSGLPSPVESVPSSAPISPVQLSAEEAELPIPSSLGEEPITTLSMLPLPAIVAVKYGDPGTIHEGNSGCDSTTLNVP